MKTISVVICCFTLLFSGIASAEGEFVSAPTSTVESSEFFNFFNLEKIALQDTENPDESISVYTNSNNFRGQIFLFLHYNNKSNIVKSVSVVIQRQFIDNPNTSPLARDYAKSFIAVSLSTGDIQIAQSLIEEIWNLNQAANTREKPSLGYLTFLGQTQNTDTPLKDARLILKNTEIRENKVLMIVIEPL